MANILDVSKYLLSKVDRDSGDDMTHLKLQKLCYYAQAWHLAINDKPLCNTSFQAWAHGPVSPDLWYEYRDYGFNPIGYPDDFNPDSLTKDEQQFLDEVWDVYGKYTAKYLEKLSHQEAPWVKARGDSLPGERCDKVIDEESIKEYYRSLLNDGEEED